jgi:hypothetical protein
LGCADESNSFSFFNFFAKNAFFKLKKKVDSNLVLLGSIGDAETA